MIISIKLLNRNSNYQILSKISNTSRDFLLHIRYFSYLVSTQSKFIFIFLYIKVFYI